MANLATRLETFSETHVKAPPKLRVESARSIASPRGLWQVLIEDCADEGTEVDLRRVWVSLEAGEAGALDAFLTERHAVVVVDPRTGSRSASNERNLSFLRYTVECASVTAAAIDFDVSASAGSLRMSNALRGMGLAASGLRIPLPVALLAHAAACPRPHLARRISDPAQPELAVIYTARPDLAWRPSFPPAEWEATKLLVEGLTHAEIAKARRVAKRTVANQLSSAFRRLGVSGRLELVRQLLCGSPPSPLECFPILRNCRVPR
jgi:DNA-binding CsgD family transcriptional regulator